MFMSQARTWIFNAIYCGLFVLNCLMWEIVVGFVDIGGFTDHHCLNFLFIIYTMNWYLRTFDSYKCFGCYFFFNYSPASGRRFILKILVQCLKISSLCVWGLKTGIKARFTNLFRSFGPNTHTLYILRRCINIVFMLQKNPH